MSLPKFDKCPKCGKDIEIIPFEFHVDGELINEYSSHCYCCVDFGEPDSCDFIELYDMEGNKIESS